MSLIATSIVCDFRADQFHPNWHIMHANVPCRNVKTLLLRSTSRLDLVIERVYLKTVLFTLNEEILFGVRDLEFKVVTVVLKVTVAKTV